MEITGQFASDGAGMQPLPLSMRETQVLELAAEGLTNREIAGRLGLSVHSIKFHLAAVFRKLGVGNRTEAAAVFFRAEYRMDTRH